MSIEKSGPRRHGYAVEPLGILGVLAGQPEFEQRRGELRGLVESLPKEERGLIAIYLRSGAIVLPIMEYTIDVLEGAFGVPGGSGLLTDGVYYWRGDAADYVEYYGIALPDDFLRHGRALGWLPQPVPEEDVLDVCEYLETHVFRVRPAGERAKS